MSKHQDALQLRAACDDFGTAMELAYQYLARIRVARAYAEVAVEYLERWAAGHVLDTSPQKMSISQAAQHLNVTVDMLRNWERNGLIQVPRDPSNDGCGAVIPSKRSHDPDSSVSFYQRDAGVLPRFRI